MDLQYMFMVMATFLAGIYTIRADEANRKIYCGKHLSQTLSAVCKGNYNTLNKKPDIYLRPSRFVANPEDTPEFPFRSKASATTMMSSFRRRNRRGVFNECCEKPCSHEELRSYCGSVG